MCTKCGLDALSCFVSGCAVVWALEPAVVSHSLTRLHVCVFTSVFHVVTTTHGYRNFSAVEARDLTPFFTFALSTLGTTLGTLHFHMNFRSSGSVLLLCVGLGRN